MGWEMIQRLQVRTSAKTEFLDITKLVEGAVRKTGMEDGLCFVYVPHTTAGVTINENADPNVSRDILTTLNKMVPLHDPYQHVEGNAPAHIKASLVGSSVQVPIAGGRLMLGTWQGIFFCEFDGPRRRSLGIQISGK